MLFEFERITKGLERAYAYGDTEEEALAEVQGFTSDDIDSHEDLEWTDWECTDTIEEE